MMKSIDTLTVSSKPKNRAIAVITNDLQYAAAYKHEERRRSVEAFLPGLCSFLRQMREVGVPIIHLQLSTPSDDPRSANLPDELRFCEGSKGIQMLEQVLEATDFVMAKPKDSGFFDTDLEKVLNDMGVKTVILTGMQAQICIQTTAADAYFRGFKVLVPSDGVVSTREEDILRALDWLKNYCARVLTMKEIVDLISDDEFEVDVDG